MERTVPRRPDLATKRAPRHRYLLLAVIWSLPAAALCQTLFPVLGGERAGTTSMTFLKIGVNARAEGMAGAFVAVADDPSCLYWNPAGMVRMKRPSGVLFNFVEWVAQVQYGFFYYGIIRY